MPDVAGGEHIARPQISQEIHEFGVVDAVLGEYPGTMTEAEVIRRVCRGRSDQAGAVYEAIRELISFGVLTLEGERLHVSGPALHLHRLVEVP